MGSFIGKNHTSFDPRNYGVKKLSDLVRRQPYVEVADTLDSTGVAHLEVRLR